MHLALSLCLSLCRVHSLSLSLSLPLFRAQCRAHTPLPTQTNTREDDTKKREVRARHYLPRLPPSVCKEGGAGAASFKGAEPRLPPLEASVG